MKSVFFVRSAFVALFIATMILTGCPPDVGVQISVTPDSLDYGQTAVRRVLRVSKGYSGNAAEPIVVSTDQDWILPANCLDFSDQCITKGPLDKVRIPVRIDRNKLHLGLNVGHVYIQSWGASRVTVPVLAHEILQADFRADQTRVSFSRPVEFSDTSLTTDASGAVIRRRWDFGDGGTSTAANPVHVYKRSGTFDVSLTVETTKGSTRTATKENYIVVEDPAGTVAFSASHTNILLGDAVTFNDISTLENTPVLSRHWDFGDGNTSTATQPTHTFGAPGIYSVTLTLTTASGVYSKTKDNFIVVRDSAALQVDFAYENAYVAEDTYFYAVLFGQTGDVLYTWDFGDGSPTSTEANPVHRFPGKGVYDVELTIIDDKGATSVQKTIEVRYRPPQVLFRAQPTRQTRGQSIQFTDMSIEGFGSIVAWHWSFGDGNMSTEQNPTHTYERVGKYTVALKVTSDDPDAQTSRLSKRNFIEIVDTSVVIDEELDLDRYINFNDGCFSYTAPRSEFVIIQGQPLARAYIVDTLTSQCWNPDNAVSDEFVPWTHPVTIVDPLFKVSDTAMLFIDGGSRNSAAEMNEVVAQLAILSGTTIVHLKNVPSQPIVFKDEVIPPGVEDNYTGEPNVLRRRTEDAIIAYSYDKYLRSYRETDGEPTYEWPLLFPMAKAAVKAMDMAEEILAANGVQPDGFIIAGASKRGWTTWLAGAADRRVKGIAPIVINVLNMKPHLEHHRASYGYWSPAIYDYAQKGIFEQLVSPGFDEPISEEAQALLDRVDPYEYALRGRYPMPKFMMNATGDEFFVPDTDRLYFDDLESAKHLSYVPNVGHGMGGLDEDDLTNPESPAGRLLAWYMAVAQGRPLPNFKETHLSDGAIQVEVDTNDPPLNVRLWQATSVNVRDFRNRSGGAAYIGPEWTATDLAPQSPGVYRGRPAEPATGNYRAFFIELVFSNPSTLPQPALLAGFTKPNFVFTTGVRVLPVDVNGNPTFPVFAGYNANALRPDAVSFAEDFMPVIALYGTPYRMGRDYGELLATDINAFIPQYIDAFKNETGTTDNALMSTWSALATDLDTRILDEINGIAEGSGIGLTQLQMAHAAALYSGGLWDSSSTVAYGNLLNGAAGGHGVTVNSDLGLALADYLCAILYIPNEGAPHTLLTYAGLAVGYTGINLGGISTSEVPDPDGPVRNENALPLMRSILYDAFSLRDAIAMTEAAPPLNTSLVFGDGRNESRAVRIRTNGNGIVPPMRYDLAQEEFGGNEPGIIYDSSPDLRALLRLDLNDLINGFDLTDLYGISIKPPYAASGRNVLNVVYDTLPLNIIINKADAPLEAFRNQPAEFMQMQLLLP